ncbi:MAG: GTPase ObgE [Planctomycetes bacterium]|nr:GTPase ObgE [Planctomycetota bacterium]
MFTDEIEIEVGSGDGGTGCLSFRREKYAPRGGPDGGDGGRGGDVYLAVNDSITSLFHLKFRQSYKAGNGRPGEGGQCSGKKGEDIVVEVPRGTVVRDALSNELIVDLGQDSERWLGLEGGQGGRGNQHFKSSKNRAPRHFEKGQPGTGLRLQLSLKLIADVGLVGLPNAGKSSLLSRISAAHPKIADYPFTTLAPLLGTLVFDNSHQIVFADLPGLIEGASEGRGLGIHFLKHIERTRMLLHLVDPLPDNGRSPVENVLMIRRELMNYSPELAAKPQLLVLSKVDLKPDPELVRSWERELGESLHPVSTASGEGLQDLISLVSAILRELDPQ